MHKVTGVNVGVDNCELHCFACGARLGYFSRGISRDVPCERCKRKMSFKVLDKEVILRCNRNRS